MIEPIMPAPPVITIINLFGELKVKV